MKRKLIVIGGGTAGFVAAITAIRTCSDVSVTVIRSRALGHIMVGEGTFAATPRFFHDVLGIPRPRFYMEVNPTWKLGIRLLWGPRAYFDYPFTEQFDNQVLPSSHEPWGYYCLDGWQGVSAFPKDQDEHPRSAGVDPKAKIPERAGYHIENHPFVECLERYFVDLGGTLIDAKVTSAQVSEKGIDSIRLESGESHAADFFVDASGFSGQLIHKELGEPQVSMRDHLFCDRAVVGGWERDDEPIKLYTTAETMDAGWCWQIEHERVINRGYVHSSAHLSDDEAADEFMRKNPKVDAARLRIVPFETRRLRRAWVKNVVAIGNACGFIEPLEATNIQVICIHALRFAEAISVDRDIDAATIDAYNDTVASEWNNIRDFLALHYRFNTRLNTPFWEMAVHDTPLGELEEYVKTYQSTGPILLTGQSSDGAYLFGHDGCLALLLGMRVPWGNCQIR